jgi:hypothetical protein
MCVSAYIFRKNRDRRVETVGELAKALGVRVRSLPVLNDSGDYRPRWNECLCNVDMEKLAEMRGLICEPPEWKDGTDHYDGWALREDRA